MFLNSYLKSNKSDKIIIDNIYLKIVNISRNKIFYQKLSVPDTIDGRFDLLVLFSVISMYFFSKMKTKGHIVSQSLFDKIFLDLDLSLREVGAGDAGVNIKIKNMAGAFMGRQKVYCSCLDKRDFVLLKKSLIKNVYRNVDNFYNSPDDLTNYCEKIFNLFNTKTNDYFLTDKFIFPDI